MTNAPRPKEKEQEQEKEKEVVARYCARRPGDIAL